MAHQQAAGRPGGRSGRVRRRKQSLWSQPGNIQAAITSLMDACTAAGAIRTDIQPTDIGAALEGIALTSAGAEHRQQAERLLDLTLDGLTVRP
ncbi:hypothetical protein ABZ907_47305 [Nonomuraea wenchangensis]